MKNARLLFQDKASRPSVSPGAMKYIKAARRWQDENAHYLGYQGKRPSQVEFSVSMASGCLVALVIVALFYLIMQ